MYWFQEIVISNLLQVIRECIQLILIGSNEVSKSVRGSHLNSWIIWWIKYTLVNIQNVENML